MTNDELPNHERRTTNHAPSTIPTIPIIPNILAAKSSCPIFLTMAVPDGEAVS